MDSDDRTSTAERNGRVVLSWQPAGRTRQAITVSEGGECISVDKIDLLVEKERQRLATRIAQKTKQPQGKVLAALAQFAAEVLEAQRQAAEADDDQGKQPASTLQGEEIRLSWPEPWPEAVDLAAVLDEIVATIRRYILMTAAQADAVALWLCWSYSVDDFDAAPLLVVNSPVKRCGKTTLGRIVAKIAPRTLAASGISPARCIA